VAVKADKKLDELALQFHVHPRQITNRILRDYLQQEGKDIGQRQVAIPNATQGPGSGASHAALQP
jgi:hypothetical protein